MKAKRTPHLGGLCALLACLLAPACRERRPEPTTEDSPALRFAARDWTRAFLQEGVLVADEIHLEGPEDLLSHVAIQQDPEAIEYSTRTVTTGLLQELSARPEIGVEVRAQLDAWSLAALRRMTILQRPGEVPITLRAVGNAVWLAADGSGERRGETLVFQGVRGK